MAAETAEKEEETVSVEDGEKKSSSKMMIVIAAAVVLMLVEGAAMFLFLSPAPASEEDVEAKAAEAIADGLTEVEADSDLVEIEMSPSFNVTNTSADLDTLVHVTFDLVAAVSTSNADTFKTAATENYKNRLREVVNEIVRSATLEELNDPDLNQLKRRIRESLNKTLQHSYVVKVIIPKMIVHVQ